VYENASVAIDNLLTDHHHIAPAKVSTGHVARLRARALRNLQKAGIRVWTLRDWTFVYVEDDATVSIPANGHSDTLPATWASDGTDGGVFLKNEPGTPLVYRRPGVIAEWLRTRSSERGIPGYYTIDGLDTVKVFPPPSEATPLHVRFKRACPTFADSTGAGNGFDAFPPNWRGPVLYELGVWYELKDKGDVQQMPAQMEIVKDGIFQMVMEERQGRPWDEDLPRHPASADLWDDLV
jgi:hypothetical protein